MTRFLGNWTVETDIFLPENVPYLRFDHPNNIFTAFLRNAPEQSNEEMAYLSMQFVFEAAELKGAAEVGRGLAKEFLSYLTLVTSMKLRLNRLHHIFNWEEPGVEMRDALYFTSVPEGDAPYPFLKADLLDTTAVLLSQAASPRVKRAVRWFASGVSSRFPEDQFTFFWLVVELVAQELKEPTLVPDRCSACRNPLFCPACNAIQLHRPYPKQAIEQLFRRFVSDTPDEAYKRSSEARNMLTHGEDTTAIEAEIGMPFVELVNLLGRLAWTALADLFTPSLRGHKVSFLHPSMYVPHELTGSIHMNIGLTPDFMNPDPKHFPKIELSLERVPLAEEPATPLT